MKKLNYGLLFVHKIAMYKLLLQVPRLFFITLSLFFLTSCQKENTETSGTATPQTLLNVAYGTDTLQKMDIYLPAGRNDTTTKVLIMIHGGGWNEGDKKDFTAYAEIFKITLPEYAIFNINYRLFKNSTNLFPAQENDVKKAIEFIYSNKNKYNISDKYVLLGASAGSHLALLHAYKYLSPVKIKAVVDFFGPTELTEWYTNAPIPQIRQLLDSVVGGTPATKPLLYQQSSPLNFVTGQSPPTIILQGGKDILVPPSQSELLKAKLESLGVVNQYVYYPNENHGWLGDPLKDSFEKIVLFLRTNVQ